MTVILEELLHLRTDRSARIGLSVGLAVLYLLFVLSQDAGLSTDLMGLLVAPTIVLWRRAPAVAVLFGAAACVVLPVSQFSTVWGIFTLGPLLLVVLPVLGAALDDRRWVRGGGIALAALFAVCVAVWGFRTDALPSQSGLLLSALLLGALPIAGAAMWRRPSMRDAILTVLRERAPRIERDSSRFRVAVIVAICAYLLVVGLGLGARDLRPVLAGAPLAASIVWFRNRTDVSLALAAVGLLLIAILAPLDSGFRGGLTLTVLYAVVAVFGAATSGSVQLRRAGMGLVAGTALVASALGGSILVGFAVLVVGALPYLFDLLAHQTRAARKLQTRLKESERRGKVAERDVRVEQDRNRIARDVHDVVAHSLAVVIAQADGARFAAEASPASVGPALDAIAETARTALGEVRTMLHDLKHDGTETVVPGAADVPALVEGVRALGVDVEEVVYGEPATLDEPAGLAMYRIVQEALTNALRHGEKESPVRLEADWGDSVVVLAISNRTDPHAVAATERQGHGIDGMRERAELAGGECTAGPGSDGSFRVRVTLPVQPRTSAFEVDDAEQVPSAGKTLSLGALLRFGAPARA